MPFSSRPYRSDIFPAHSPKYTDPQYDPRFFAPFGPYEVNATNRLAKFSGFITIFNLVIGTLSLILVGPFLAIFLCVVGIISAHCALRQLRRSYENGRAIAVVSLILNYMGLFFLLAITCLLFFVNSIGRALLGM